MTATVSLATCLSSPNPYISLGTASSSRQLDPRRAKSELDDAYTLSRKDLDAGSVLSNRVSPMRRSDLVHNSDYMSRTSTSTMQALESVAAVAAAELVQRQESVVKRRDFAAALQEEQAGDAGVDMEIHTRVEMPAGEHSLASVYTDQDTDTWSQVVEGVCPKTDTASGMSCLYRILSHNNT